MSWDRERLRALDAVTLLECLLRDPGAYGQRVTEGYLDAKRALAVAFQARALEQYGSSEVLDYAIGLIEHGIQATFPGLPARHSHVLGYGSVHSALLAYLVDRVGKNVPSDELRILTRDAVHTERRARDLRDLGYTLRVGTSSGAQVYCLDHPVPDIAEGVRLTVAKNIRNDSRLTKGQRQQRLSELGLSASAE